MLRLRPFTLCILVAVVASFTLTTTAEGEMVRRNIQDSISSKTTSLEGTSISLTKKFRYDTIRTHPPLPHFSHKRKMITKVEAIYSYSAPTKKKIYVGGRKAQGYRIQLFAGGDTRADYQKASAIGRKAKQYFPNEPIYTHFYSPRWICRIGNYETQDMATKMLVRVQRMGFLEAGIVKSPVTLKRKKYVSPTKTLDETDGVEIETETTVNNE